jgi:uncharacterized protein YutE (UPF0331/DUF86 family)
VTTDVLMAKLASIERCLNRIRTVTKGDPSTVRELDVQEIVLLNLQRGIQSVIDLAGHVISTNGWGLPDSLKQHFTILEQQKIVGADLAERLRSMAGFRNIAIHNYQALDPAILEQIVANHLVDLEEFAEAIKVAVASR